MRTAKSCSGVVTNLYTKGIAAKKAVPISSQSLRPDLSESIPKVGLRTMPVRVETETMTPSKTSWAPRAAA